MSDYTITLKRCSEVYSKPEVLSWFTNYDLHNYLSQQQINELTGLGIFGTDGWTKEYLAEMIFEHYYLREIAYETPEMFRHYSKVKMQEIMRKISSFIVVGFN